VCQHCRIRGSDEATIRKQHHLSGPLHFTGHRAEPGACLLVSSSPGLPKPSHSCFHPVLLSQLLFVHDLLPALQNHPSIIQCQLT
jgi:hypothetical protein